MRSLAIESKAPNRSRAIISSLTSAHCTLQCDGGGGGDSMTIGQLMGIGAYPPYNRRKNTDAAHQVQCICTSNSVFILTKRSA